MKIIAAIKTILHLYFCFTPVVATIVTANYSYITSTAQRYIKNFAYLLQGITTAINVTVTIIFINLPKILN